MPGRNDPCPCGSGKKYKKCCLVSEKTFMEGQGTPNMATDLLNELKNQLGDSPCSIDEVRDITSGLMKEQKSSSIDDFLGLSSDHMHGILYSHLFSAEDILSLSDGDNVDSVALLQIPVIKQALYLLNKLGESEKGIKATKTGNLPRSLVQSFYFDYVGETEEFRGKPMSQIDVRELDLLMFALKEIGLIKIRTGWISLTKKGKSLLDEKNHFDLYSKLFFFYGDSLDWLSTTYYNGGFGIIQKALSFNLYILKKRAENFLLQNEIVDVFHKAFPQVGEVSIPFVSLFLDNFCLYFGLVERDESRTLIDRRKELKYRQSSLFSVILEWKK